MLNKEKKRKLECIFNYEMDNFNFLYIIKYFNKKHNCIEYYVGETVNLFHRFRQHLAGRSSAIPKCKREDKELVYFEFYDENDNINILKREEQFRKLSNKQLEESLSILNSQDKYYIKQINDIIKNYKYKHKKTKNKSPVVHEFKTLREIEYEKVKKSEFMKIRL